MNGIGSYNNSFFVIRNQSELIKESLYRIFFTSKNERVMLPFGIGLQELLFDLNNVLEEDLIQMIESEIRRYEPRIILLDTTVQPIYPNTLKIGIRYIEKESGLEQNLNLNAVGD